MSKRWQTAIVAGLSLSCWLGFVSCRDGNNGSKPAQHANADAANIEELRPAVTAFCGNCHAAPPPESFPRDAWFAETEQGYRFYSDSGRTDLKPPPMQDVVTFFRSQAPKVLTIPSYATSLTAANRFRKQSLPKERSAPAISFLDLAPRRGTGGIWLCDMHSGAISNVMCNSTSSAAGEIANVANPAHIVECDLDQDGRGDLIVADLGSFLPGDHQDGRVVWLPGAGEPNSPRPEVRVLLDQVGRVADVRPADFDGDGDIDLIVAEFGWRKTGRILLLLQTHRGPNGPEFSRTVIDRRHGAIHVPIADLNQDGKPDFVALISQEHEVIEAYLNLGGGHFEKQGIFMAPDPAFGLSGIEVVDLDLDGDLDVVATNGDTLDSHYLKPSHGITWLENQGKFPFAPRRLSYLPGAMRAVCADVDHDGDLDIIAAAFLPASLRTQQPKSLTETLIWLEQTETSGEFQRHTLETGDAGHMTVLAADLDADGDIDLAVPNYGEQRTINLEPLTIWWNEKSRAPAE